MSETSSTPRIVVVGAGAAGSLTALHLARTARRRGTPLEVVLLDPAAYRARGTAFGTTDERHLLNVPAGGMSALPEEPGHFVAWRARHHPELLPEPCVFAPRARVGPLPRRDPGRRLRRRRAARSAPPARARRRRASRRLRGPRDRRRRAGAPRRRGRPRDGGAGAGLPVGARRAARLRLLRPRPLGARRPRRRTTRRGRAGRRPAGRHRPDHGRRRRVADRAGAAPRAPDPCGVPSRQAARPPCRASSSSRRSPRSTTGAIPSRTTASVRPSTSPASSGPPATGGRRWTGCGRSSRRSGSASTRATARSSCASTPATGGGCAIGCRRSRRTSSRHSSALRC